MPTTTTGVATSFIDFTRASNATVTDSDGKLKWSPHNLLTNSESFASSPWSATAASIVSNASTAPNGTSTADAIDADGSGALHYVQVIASFTYVNASYTLAAFMKKDTNRYGWISPYDGTSSFGGVFDLQNGVYVGNRTGGGTTAATITPFPNGWYLCTVTYTPAAATTSYPAAFGTNNDGSLGLSDASTGQIFIWGAHLYRSDLGGMQPNTSAYPMYNPTTPKNLLGYTEAFGSWSASSAAVLSDSLVSPNGLQTVDKVYPTSSAGRVTQTAGTYAVKTISVYAKAGEMTAMNIRVPDNVGAAMVYANLVTGATTIGNVVYDPWCTHGAVDMGNGWWRVWLAINANGPSASTVSFAPCDAVGSTASTASGTNGIYLWGAQLSDSASLDAYSPVYGAAVTSAAYYGPRRDFDGATLACKGLLVEEQRANLLTYSADFSQWTPTNASAATDDIASPDGTVTADRITSTASNSGYIQKTIYGTTVGATYTLSGYFKAGSQKYVTFYDESSGLLAAYDLEAGTVVSGGANASIVPVGNSWFRCIRVITSNLANYKQISISGGTLGLGGNWPNSTSFYAWGAQLDSVSGGNASFATSYIPTGSATATRNADVASVSTQAFPYGASEGTLVANASWTNAAVATVTNQRIALMGSPGDNYARSIQRQDSSATGVALYYRGMSSGGVNIATSGNTAKSGLAWSSAGGSGSVNGSAASALTGTPTTSDGLPINILRIGNAGDNTFFNGHILQITYLPRRVTNAELQTRTT